MTATTLPAVICRPPLTLLLLEWPLRVLLLLSLLLRRVLLLLSLLLRRVASWRGTLRRRLTPLLLQCLGAAVKAVKLFA